MKSSKKFLAKVLTAALAFSMAAGTGICAAAADTEETSKITSVPLYKFDATQSLLSKLLSEGKNLAGQVTKISHETLQKIQNIAEQLKAKSQKYDYRKGVLYLNEGEFTYLVHLSLSKGIFAELISYSGTDTEITVPPFADGIPVTRIFSFSVESDGNSHPAETLNIPFTVDSFSAADTFNLFHLKNINVDSKSPYFTSVDGVVFSKNMTKLVALPPVRTSYTVPDTVTAVGEFACYASELEEIHFPKNLASIGEYAFFSSVNLKEIKLPNGTKNIGDSAFGMCINLEKAVIPSSVSKIYQDAFSDCENLVIYADGESEALYYAQEHNIDFKVPLQVLINAVIPDTIPLGSSVTIDGDAYYGSGEYLYSVLYKKSADKKWTVKQGFQENDVVTLTPAYTGTYDICVKVKDSDGSIAKTFTQVEVTEAFANQSSISADTIQKGETVTVTAVPQEGMENCTYAFYYKKVSDTKWTQKQGFDTNSSVTVKPAYATDYQICVKIKDENGNISKKYFDLTVQPKN